MSGWIFSNSFPTCCTAVPLVPSRPFVSVGYIPYKLRLRTLQIRKSVGYEKTRPPPYPTNFERPFTPQTWLRSASNLAKTRFGRSPTFYFSTPKKSTFSDFSRFLIGRLPPEDSSDWPQTWPKRVSDDPRRFIFRHQKHQNFANRSQTLSGRLPPEDGSDWAETWPKRVSDDPRHFIFRHLKKKVFFWCSTSKHKMSGMV